MEHVASELVHSQEAEQMGSGGDAEDEEEKSVSSGVGTTDQTGTVLACTSISRYNRN